MADIVSGSIDEITLDDFISFAFERGVIFDFEGFFALFSFIACHDVLGDFAVIRDDIVELPGIDIALDRIDEVDDFHIRRLTTLRHRIYDVDDLPGRRMEGFAHSFTEEIGYYSRIEVSRSDDDIVGILYRFTGTRIEIPFIADEPSVYDILVEIV